MSVASVVKQPTSYREMLGSYASPKLMNLFSKSFVLVRTCIVDDQSYFRCVVTWIDKMKGHSNKIFLYYFNNQTHPHPQNMD
jgi:hypothetical protein